nr:sorting nexin-22-like [Vicugna pacos]
MLEVHIPSVGPETEGPRQNPEKGHMVFRVEVLCRGRRHTVQRRYSEFHALHKRVRRRPPPTLPLTDRRPAPALSLGGGQKSRRAPASTAPA